MIETWAYFPDYRQLVQLSPLRFGWYARLVPHTCELWTEPPLRAPLPEVAIYPRAKQASRCMKQMIGYVLREWPQAIDAGSNAVKSAALDDLMARYSMSRVYARQVLCQARKQSRGEKWAN